MSVVSVSNTGTTCECSSPSTRIFSSIGRSTPACPAPNTPATAHTTPSATSCFCMNPPELARVYRTDRRSKPLTEQLFGGREAWLDVDRNRQQLVERTLDGRRGGPQA